MSLPVERWDYQLFEELQHLLARISSQPTTSTIRRFMARLDDAAPWMLTLTNLPGPDEQARQALEKDPLTLPSGATVKVTGDLLNTTNSISNLLQLSPKFSAILALQAEELRSHYVSRSIPEIATYILHNFLSEMLAFLHELLRLTIGPDAVSDPPFDTLRVWVQDFLVKRTSLGPGKAEGSLADLVLDQVDVQQKVLDGLMQQRATGPEYDLLVYRVNATRAEQCKLTGLLGIVARGGMLGRGHLVKVLKWLKKCNRMDGIAGSIFATFMAVSTPIDLVPTGDPRYEMLIEWGKDIRFLKVASNLVLIEDWTLTRLREAAKIPWSLFILSTLKQDPVAAQVGIDPLTADQYMYDGVNGDAFPFLRDRVLQIRLDRDLDIRDEVDSNVDVLAQLAERGDREQDEFYLDQLQILVRILAGKKNFVRNIRNREEDLASRRSQAGPARANYQAFQSLIASVYQTLPPDSAVHLWEDPNFIGTICDQRGHTPSLAFWQMISAITKGTTCAARAYEQLKETSLSWSGLREFYEYYLRLLPRIFEPIKTTRDVSLEPMGDEDVALCEGWTMMITTIVQWSPLARNTLLQQKPYPLQLLFDFLNCELPLRIKTVVMKAITAFTKRTGDAMDDDTLSKAIEYYERVTHVDPGLDTRLIEAAKIPPPVGWVAKMEYAEAEVGLHSLTRAYLEFLTSLLPPGPPMKPRLMATLRRSVYYVVDRVLIPLPARRLAREAERWELLDAGLAFLEKSLLVFDMSGLFTLSKSRTIGPLAEGLWYEPGFVIMLRMLSEPGIFNVLSNVLDYASNLGAPRPKNLSVVVLRLLRIYHRVIESQLVFSDVLVLALVDCTRNSGHPFRRPLNLVSFDHLLLNHLSNVNAIALLVGDDDLPVSLLATRIMAALSTSPVFGESDRFLGEYAHPINRLAGIVDASDDSIRISQGFCSKLDADGPEISPEEDRTVSNAVITGSDITPDTLAALPLNIRTTILDLLIEGTSPDSVGPNLSHFLLGYEFKGHDFVLQDPSDPNSRLSCLQVILEQMTDDSGTSLVEVHPVLAAKSARLMHQLFTHPITSRTTIAYASSFKAFSAVQLALLPRECPSRMTDDAAGKGSVALYDSSVETTASILEAYLNFQRDVISCAAIETHAYEGRGASAEVIAELLFNGTSGENDEEDAFGQRPPLIIDLLGNIDLEWTDATDTSQDRNLDFYGSFDFDRYKRADANWWDLDALEKGLTAQRRQLERQGAIGTSSEAMPAEADYLLLRLAVQNRQTDINIAKGSFLAAWSEVLKVALGELFSNVSDDRQEVVLMELLESLLDRLSGDVTQGVLDILCEAILITTSKLVEVMTDYEGSNLPVKQLTPLLARIVEAVIRPQVTESCRGNLYATINQYLSLLALSQPQTFDDGASMASTIATSNSTSPGSEFRHATLAVLNTYKDRFLAVLCRDAMEVRDVWKTECFTLLGVLVSACKNDRERQALSPLSKEGYLSLFVRSLKDREIPLQECLAPNPDSLHAYWVYEAKITFLLAFASTRKGAEGLLDAGLFEVLAMCNFITVQPINEDSIREATEEAVTRQHKVLICALQLVTRTLSSLHRSSRSGAGHAISFLNAHRDAIIVLLRESQQSVHLMGIEECRLIISLLSLVRHKVPEEDMRSPSGFGAFHLAVLSVAARFLDPEAWVENMTDRREEARIQAEPQVLALNQVILAYLTTATNGLGSGSGHPVLVNSGYRSGQAAKYIASAPSLQMVVDVLSDLAEAAQDLSGEYQGVLDAFAAGGVPDDRTIQRLTEAGLISLPWTEASLLIAFPIRSQVIMNMIESILLLLWRHLLFYANDARSPTDALKPDNLSQSLAGSMAGLDGSRYAQGMMKSLEKVAATLGGILDRISDLDGHPDLGKGVEDAYFGMLMRRLKELTGGLAS